MARAAQRPNASSASVPAEPAPVVDISRARSEAPKDDVLVAFSFLASLFNRPDHDVRKQVFAVHAAERPAGADPFTAQLPDICRAVFGQPASTSPYYQLKERYGWELGWLRVDGRMRRRLTVVARVHKVYTCPAADVGQHIASIAHGVFLHPCTCVPGATFVSRAAGNDPVWVAAYTFVFHG